MASDAQAHTFDASIHLRPTGEGRFSGSLDRAWWVAVGPNGGFLASILLNAIVTAVDDRNRSPRSLSVHYPGRAAEGRFEIEVSIDRRGRSMTFASARMTQRRRLLSTAVCALSNGRTSREFQHLLAPEVAAPEDIGEIVTRPREMPPFVENFDYRIALGSFPYTQADRAEIGGWIRTRPPRAVDALLIPTLTDAYPPAVFSAAAEPFPVPTIDLTVHFRGELPIAEKGEDEWCLCRFRSTYGAGGFVEEDGEIWSRSGRLIAHSRQLAIFGTDMTARTD